MTFNVTIQNGTGELDQWYFTYNGTFGNKTAAVNGSNSIVWNYSAVGVGNYSIVPGANDTDGLMDDGSAVWVYVYNNTIPEAVNVSISNAPLASPNNASCGCDCYDFDYPWQMFTYIRNYTWWVNGTQVDQNVSNLTFSTFGDNANVSCGCQCYDGLNWGLWANSSEIVVGDILAPYNSTTPSASASSACSTDTITFSVNITDATSNIASATLETTTPSGNVSYAMTCTSGTDVQCTRSFTGVLGSITIWGVNYTDSSMNRNYTLINQTITFTDCTSGGGGGGGIFSMFKIYPRVTIGSIERPEDAHVIGKVGKPYRIEASSSLSVDFEWTNTTSSVNGESVDATKFFRTSPSENTFIVREMNFTIYCDIPDQYKYPPFGIFNSTLIVGHNNAEAVHVVCESDEHAQGAGALMAFLNEVIPGLGIPVWQFFLLIVILAIIVAYLF